MTPPTPHLDHAAWDELIRVLAAVNSSLDPDQVLTAIATSAARIMNAEAGSVLTLDRRGDKLVFAAASGPVGADLIGSAFDAKRGIAGKAISTGQVQVVSDVAQDPDFFSGIDDKSAFVTRELIAAPMVFREKIIGVVEVLNRREGDFDEHDVELLRLFAELAATGVHNAATHAQLKRENAGLRLAADTRAAGIIGGSSALADTMKLCRRVAPSNATVLLLGETGTGKELTARHIHTLSERREKPFIGINCAALAETLLESELFGHEKGAFTGAVARKIGRFELADGGTLFLDEIGDISPATQVKLLRVLQEREFVRVGGTQTVACDVRVIAATNRDLAAAISAGDFREDLYYRLNVFPIQLPPLRERREDIPELVGQFIQRAAADLGVPAPALSSAASALLTSHRWPGNIRELQNVVERMVLMCDGGEILPMHLPREIAGAAQDNEAASTHEAGLRGYERAMIVQALADNGWNQTRAAQALGISRDNLRYRVKKYGIKKPAS